MDMRHDSYTRHNRRSSLGISMADIDQLLLDRNEMSDLYHPLRPQIPTIHHRQALICKTQYQHDIQIQIQNRNEPFIRRDNVSLHKIDGRCDRYNGHSRRRSTLGSVMSTLSCEESFGPIESINYGTNDVNHYNTHHHGKIIDEVPQAVTAINHGHRDKYHRRMSTLNSGMSIVSDDQSCGPTDSVIYVHDHHDRTDAISNPTSVTQSYQQNNSLHRRMNESAQGSFALGMNTNKQPNPSDQGAFVRANLNVERELPEPKPWQFRQELEHLMNLMDASERSRRSVRKIKMKMHRDVLINSLQNSNAENVYIRRHSLDTVGKDDDNYDDDSSNAHQYNNFHPLHRTSNAGDVKRAPIKGPRRYKDRPYSSSTI